MYVTLKLPLNNVEMEVLIVKSMDYTWLDVKDAKKMNLPPQVFVYIFIGFLFILTHYLASPAMQEIHKRNDI